MRQNGRGIMEGEGEGDCGSNISAVRFNVQRGVGGTQEQRLHQSALPKVSLSRSAPSSATDNAFLLQ